MTTRPGPSYRKIEIEAVKISIGQPLGNGILSPALLNRMGAALNLNLTFKLFFFLKMANHGLFLCIFVLFLIPIQVTNIQFELYKLKKA